MALQLFIISFVKPWASQNRRFFIPLRVKSPFLTPSERIRFIQAYHLTWTLVIGSQGDSDEELIDQIVTQTSAQTIDRIKNLVGWMADVQYTSYRERWSGFDTNDRAAVESNICWTKIPADTKEWWASAQQVYYSLPSIAAREAKVASVIPDYAPEGAFSWFDDYQSYVTERSH